jgi:4-hydroxy-tetrahydrodipicolinate synthase
MPGSPAKAISGVFTPNMTPLDARGEINEAELRRYVDWLIAHGVHGLYPNGSTGEFTRFTPEERRRIVEIMCDQARGRVPILAGAAEANVRETLGACEAYYEFGARAVAIVSPFYYRLSPGAVYAYFREIAVNSPIDVPTVQRLAELPRIIGMKDSSGDIAQMMRMMAAVAPHRPEFSFLTGWEPTLVPMLLVGCAGGTHACSGIVPEVTRRIYELTTSGQYQQALPLQWQLTELFDRVVYGADFPEGIRAAVEARGFNFGASRQPANPEQRIDRNDVTRMIEELLQAVNA